MKLFSLYQDEREGSVSERMETSLPLRKTRMEVILWRASGGVVSYSALDKEEGRENGKWHTSSCEELLDTGV